MLVDLGRNDIGRVSAPGTVTVPRFMEIERYSHVMHIVSNVEGEIAEGLTGLDYVAFPAGTVSGAPKIRAMEIIAELETDRRGPTREPPVTSTFREGWIPRSRCARWSSRWNRLDAGRGWGR